MAERAAALVRSACSSDVGEALELLAADPSLAVNDVACACVCGEAEAVARWLAEAPQLAGEPLDPLGHAPILYACFSRLARVEPQRAAGIRAVVALLLDAGADPNAFFVHDGWLQVPLYGAAGIVNDAELTRMLIAAGANPDDMLDDDAVGEALYHAVEFPDPACAALLVEAGTRAHVVEHCLSRALDFPAPEMVEMLCAHGVRVRGRNLRHAVMRRRAVGVVAALLDAGAPIDERKGGGPTALQLATRWGSGEVVELLVARGADRSAIRAQDTELGAFLTGSSAVAPAGAEGLDEMLDVAVGAGDVRAVGRLLDAGAHLDGAPGHDTVPLGQACWRGRPDVAAELIARGAHLTWSDGSALGATRHGSRNCHDPEGGPTMRTVQEIDQEPYSRILALLRDAGVSVDR